MGPIISFKRAYDRSWRLVQSLLRLWGDLGPISTGCSAWLSGLATFVQHAAILEGLQLNFSMTDLQ